MNEFYIIVNAPAVFTNHKWSMGDSVDGVKYQTFEEASDVRKTSNIGCGIARVTNEEFD